MRQPGLTLTTTGGTVEYDCAHGGLRAPLLLDRRGDFDVAGVQRPDSAPGRFVGSIRGNRMALRVHVGADTLGPFELTRGAQSQLVKCL